MKTNKKALIKKLIICLVAVLLVVFSFTNILWVNYINDNYRPLIENNSLEYDGHGVYSYTAPDDYIYNVFMPSYLSFTSNLSINRVYDPDNPTPVSCTAIIWPKSNGKYEFGIKIEFYNSNENSDEELFSFYQGACFVLDEKKMAIEELSEEEKNIYNDYIEEINDIYNRAYMFWGIGGE